MRQLVLIGLLATVGSCASADLPRITPETVLLTQANHQKLVAAAAQTATLKRELEVVRAELRTMRRQLGALLRRAGFTTSRVAAVQPMTPVVKARLGDGIRIEDRLQKGKRSSLSSMLKLYDGLVISLWATWCVPCISDEELHHLRKLRAQLRRSGFALVSVAIDDLDKVKQHPKAAKWLYPLYFQRDAHLNMVPKAFVQKYGMGLPLFLLVSKSGRIHYFRKNKLDAAAVDGIVNTMMGMPRL